MNLIHRQPPIRAVPMNIFPTLTTLEEVIALAKSQLPIMDEQKLMTVLMTYHNTLLAYVRNS
jgi:hypothetical protein